MKFTQTMADADYKQAFIEFYARTKLTKGAKALGYALIAIGVSGGALLKDGALAFILILLGGAMFLFIHLQTFFVLRIMRKGKHYGQPTDIEITDDALVIKTDTSDSAINYTNFTKFTVGETVVLLYLNDYAPAMLKRSDLEQAGALEALTDNLRKSGVSEE